MTEEHKSSPLGIPSFSFSSDLFGPDSVSYRLIQAKKRSTNENLNTERQYVNENERTSGSRYETSHFQNRRSRFQEHERDRDGYPRKGIDERFQDERNKSRSTRAVDERFQDERNKSRSRRTVDEKFPDERNKSRSRRVTDERVQEERNKSRSRRAAVEDEFSKVDQNCGSSSRSRENDFAHRSTDVIRKRNDSSKIKRIGNSENLSLTEHKNRSNWPKSNKQKCSTSQFRDSNHSRGTCSNSKTRKDFDSNDLNSRSQHAEGNNCRHKRSATHLKTMGSNHEEAEAATMKLADLTLNDMEKQLSEPASREILEVSITYAVSKVTNFVIRKNDVETILIRINSLPRKPLTSAPMLGSIYLSEFSGVGCRAKIHKMDPLTVYYIDYGNYEEIDINRLYELPLEWQEKEPQTFKIKLDREPEQLLEEGNTIFIERKDENTWQLVQEGKSTVPNDQKTAVIS